MVTNAVEDDRMTIMEHLAELRNRLIKSALAVLGGAVVCLIFYDRIFEFLVRPYCQTLENTDANSLDGCNLVLNNPTGGLSIYFTVGVYGGLALSMPVVLWQLWRFVQPGLHPHERRYAVPFVLSGVVLFIFGAGLAYWSLPRALEFLLEIGGSGVTAGFGPEAYFSLVTKMIIAFGLGFQFPILLIFMQLAGILQNQTLRKGRRYALVGIVIGVAVITPSGDPISLLVLSTPMYVFYEASILFGILRDRRKRKSEKVDAS